MDCNIIAWHLSSCVHLKHAAELIYMVFLIVNNSQTAGSCKQFQAFDWRRLTRAGVLTRVGSQTGFM